MEAKTYTTSGTFLKINHKDATAAGINKTLSCEKLTPIKRGSTGSVIGYAYLIEETLDKVLFKIFIDYSTPERLDLENGLNMYLKMFAIDDKLDHLEFDFRGESLPVGSFF